MRKKVIIVNKKKFLGYEFKLGAKKLIFILAKKAYIMCGYLNMKSANKFKDVACTVAGVNSLEEMLKAGVGEVSLEARKLGIKKGENVRSALKKIN